LSLDIPLYIMLIYKWGCKKSAFDTVLFKHPQLAQCG